MNVIIGSFLMLLSLVAFHIVVHYLEKHGVHKMYAGVAFVAGFLLCFALIILLSGRAKADVLDGPIDSLVGDEIQRVILAPKAEDEFGELDFYIRGPYDATVSGEKTFEVNIEEAGLAWRDDSITEDTFPFAKSDIGEKTFFVIGRPGIISYEMAVNAIGNKGLRPATLQETLAFIKKYPQRPGEELIALGQSWYGKGGSWYPRYRVSYSGGSLDIFRLEPGRPWFDVCFLAVRY